MPEPQFSIGEFLSFWATVVRITWWILAIIAIAGVGEELGRGKSVIGTDRARMLFSVFSVAMILFTLGYSAFCFWYSQAYERWYAFVFIEVGLRMAPTVILAIVQLLLHRYRTEHKDETSTV